MALDRSFLEFVVGQIDVLDEPAYRLMMGGSVLYCNGKVVAQVNESQLFVKPTEAGRAFIGTVVEAPPYPGAKPFFLIEDQIEDRDWMRQLISLTEQEVPKGRKRG